VSVCKAVYIVANANNINGLANAHGLIVRNVKVADLQSATDGRGEITDSTARAGYKVTSTSVTVSGQYEQFTQFLQTLESNLYLADVNSLSIKADGKAGTGGGASKYEFTLDILTYSLR
jgi:hypothetical protein